MKQNILSLQANGFRALAKTILLCLLLVALGRWLATPASGAIVPLSWVGGTSWSAPENWDPPQQPQDGENLEFTRVGLIFDPDPMVNNLPNLTIRSMYFCPCASTLQDATWRLSGNTLGITDHIQVFSATDGRVFISCGLRLERNVRFTIERALGFEPNLELHLDGPIDLNGHNLEVFAGAGTSVDISGAISGNGNIVLSGGSGSSVGISGPEGNTFRGTVTVHFRPGAGGGSPHVVLHKQSGAAVPERLVLEESSVVTLGRSEQIADDATVELRNGADFQLNGFNETIGTLVLANVASDANATILDTGGATLTLLAGLTSWNEGSTPTPTVKGRLALPNAGEIFDIGGSAYAGLDIQAQIVGAGGFSKSGSAALILQSANTFGGSVSVIEGILDVRHNNALGSTARGVTLTENGSLTLRNATIADETLFVRGTKAVTVDTSGSLLFTIGTCLWAGPIELDTNLVVRADNTFLVGPISGPGGLEFQNGVALIGGTAANTFTGTTLVRNERLEFFKAGNASTVSAFSGPLVVGGGAGGPYEARWLGGYQGIHATLMIYANGLVNLNNFNEDFGPVTFNGGRVETGTGQFAIYEPLTVNPASVSAVINGFLGLPPGVARVFNVGDGAPDCDLIVNAVVFGNPPHLVKRGSGTMCLTAANTYFATTLVEEGILDVNNGSALGLPAGTRIFNNATLRFSGSGTMAENFQIVGAGVGGTHGVLEMPVAGIFTLTGSILMDAASTINVAQSAGLVINAVISGTGPLTKIGSGNLTLRGAGPNTYTGDTLVNQGTLFLNKPIAVTAVPGNLIVGTGNFGSSATARNLNSFQIVGNITVNRGGLLDVNGLTENVVILTLNGGGSVQTVNGTLILRTGSALNVNPGSAGSSTISGRIGLDPGTHSFAVGSRLIGLGGPECTVSAAISETSTAASLEKSGAGTLQLTGANTYRGATTINGGILRVDGVQPQSAVQVNAGTRLQGGGTVGRINFTGDTGVIAPGNGPGILTCSNFNVGLFDDGVLQIELNGTTPGSGYDQLNVHGLVKLTGITLNASLGFASAVGQQFVIINNDGFDLVGDNFNGLPQNASLYIGDEQFTISYTGGTGNDVVLTRLVTPPRPVLAIEKAPPSSVRLRWPTNAVGFTLQSNTNLNTTNWVFAPPAPTVVGTNNVVMNATNGSQKFYRLFKP